MDAVKKRIVDLAFEKKKTEALTEKNYDRIRSLRRQILKSEMEIMKLDLTLEIEKKNADEYLRKIEKHERVLNESVRFEESSAENRINLTFKEDEQNCSEADDVVRALRESDELKNNLSEEYYRAESKCSTLKKRNAAKKIQLNKIIASLKQEKSEILLCNLVCDS